MLELLKNLFASEQFIPHGHCYLWKPELVWLHIASDSLIALAYYSIPIMLVYFVLQRRDMPFQSLFWMFGCFIVACGTTHLIEIWTLWHSDYWLSGGVKVITAIVSLYTVSELFALMPKALTLPSPVQLEAMNQKLAQEIIERQRTEEALRQHQKQLEELVAKEGERTIELTQVNEQLSWQASHDALTGLVNRRKFKQCLEEAITTARTSHQEHALCYFDLDRFKIVNDTCGHLAGDELLRQVSALLQTRCRKTDTLARLGGDEFGLLLHQCSLEQALPVAQALHESIQAFRFVWQAKPFSIGVTIGMVAINAQSTSLDSVLSAADTACYAGKNQGRNRVHVYQAEDGELAQQRSEVQWVAQINQALAENRFCLYNQTIASLTAKSTGEHYEVLLRLVNETGEVILPMAFLPAAERYNLMPTIDRWVLSTFFAGVSASSGAKGSTIPQSLYAINLSGASVNDDQFIDFLKQQFDIHQIPPQQICFEITETVAIANLSKAAILIHEIRALGCRFALDDFGSGMSSFAYLKHLPVDYLKIDGCFIKDIVNDPIAASMVEAINRICHVMGIQTIAEFVTSETILTKVRTLGVDYAQGYAIALPQPIC